MPARPRNRPKLLVVSSLKTHKGLAVLAGALPKLDQDVELDVVGIDASATAQDLGTVDRRHTVSDLGVVCDDDLAELLRAADLAVFPSLGEGFDLSLVEALACGTSAVASDLPVHREVTLGVSTVCFSTVGDAEALAATIDQALAAPPSPADRLAASDLVRRTHRWDEVAARFVDAVRSCA
jgi:glycosyltransferase involved in cell wall biosynthesis